jgi:hypothetical protein
VTQQLVTIHFSNFGYGRAHINLPWVQGKKLKEYLRTPILKKYALINQALQQGGRGVRDVQNRKVKLTSVLRPGDIVSVGGRQ